MKNIKISDKFKKSYKLPILVVFVVISMLGITKIFNLVKEFKISKDVNYSMAFFAITGLIFTFIVLRNIKDIISLVFGQKGQNSLTDIAQK
jgi:hypothetical protein